MSCDWPPGRHHAAAGGQVDDLTATVVAEDLQAQVDAVGLGGVIVMPLGLRGVMRNVAIGVHATTTYVDREIADLALPAAGLGFLVDLLVVIILNFRKSASVKIPQMSFSGLAFSYRGGLAPAAVVVAPAGCRRPQGMEIPSTLRVEHAACGWVTRA